MLCRESLIPIPGYVPGLYYRGVALGDDRVARTDPGLIVVWNGEFYMPGSMLIMEQRRSLHIYIY